VSRFFRPRDGVRLPSDVLVEDTGSPCSSCGADCFDVELVSKSTRLGLLRCAFCGFMEWKLMNVQRLIDQVHKDCQ